MTQSILEIYDSCVNWIVDEQPWEYRNLDSVYFDSVNKDQYMGYKNKAGRSEEWELSSTTLMIKL